MCRLTNSEMRKRIILIAAAYCRMRERQGLPANRIALRILVKQYGFVHFTKINTLSVELEKMINHRAFLRRYNHIPTAEESCASLFKALAI